MISFLIFSLFTFSLLANPPDTVLYAAQIYQAERSKLQNYKVRHIVVSKLESSSETYIEKRIQTGYFISPDKFFFLIKEKWINHQPVKVKKDEVEKSTKREIEWLSKRGIKEYKFSYIGGNEQVAKFKVQSPHINRDWYNGEIWIHPSQYKILKIIREPSLLPVGYEKYTTELHFDTDLPFQEPYLSKLEAIFINERGEKTYVLVDASFTEYEFNIPLKTEK
jgi:hypothetical protein